MFARGERLDLFAGVEPLASRRGGEAGYQRVCFFQLGTFEEDQLARCDDGGLGRHRAWFRDPTAGGFADRPARLEIEQLFFEEHRIGTAPREGRPQIASPDETVDRIAFARSLFFDLLAGELVHRPDHARRARGQRARDQALLAIAGTLVKAELLEVDLHAGGFEDRFVACHAATL